VVILGLLAKNLKKCLDLAHFSKEVFTGSLFTKILTFGSGE